MEEAEEGAEEVEVMAEPDGRLTGRIPSVRPTFIGFSEAEDPRWMMGGTMVTTWGPVLSTVYSAFGRKARYTIAQSFGVIQDHELCVLVVGMLPSAPHCTTAIP